MYGLTTVPCDSQVGIPYAKLNRHLKTWLCGVKPYTQHSHLCS